MDFHLLQFIGPVFIIVMGALSGWSGGSLAGHDKFPKTWMPEALFAIGFAAPWAFTLQGWWLLLMIPIALWSYAWMQSATAPGLHWGGPEYNPSKKSTLKPFVDRISPWHPSTVEYCRVYMAVKGFLIGLPAGGVLLAVLWPTGYEIGNRLKNHTFSECLAGAFAGVSIITFHLILNIIAG